jgi:hypothetical protein
MERGVWINRPVTQEFVGGLNWRHSWLARNGDATLIWSCAGWAGEVEYFRLSTCDPDYEEVAVEDTHRRLLRFDNVMELKLLNSGMLSENITYYLYLTLRAVKLRFELIPSSLQEGLKLMGDNTPESYGKSIWPVDLTKYLRLIL